MTMRYREPSPEMMGYLQLEKVKPLLVFEKQENNVLSCYVNKVL